MHYFSNLFWYRTLHVSDRFSVRHQDICHAGYADCLLAGSGCTRIQYQTSDDRQKTCPKHVEYYSKNKFEKLVHLVSFIIRIYHDVRSCECQTSLRTLYFGRCIESSEYLPDWHCRISSRYMIGHRQLSGVHNCQSSVFSYGN